MSERYQLYRQRGSPYLYVAYYPWSAALGRHARKFESTKKTTEAEAKVVAESIVSAAEAIEGAAKGSPWSREHAFKLVNGLLKAAGLPEQAPIPLWKDYSEAWAELKKALVKPATMTVYRRALRAFGEWLGRGVAKRMDLFTSADLQGFYNHLLRIGETPATARVKLEVLRQVFEQAFQEEHCRRNPVKMVRKTRDARTVLKKERFSVEELRRLLAVAAQHPRTGEEWVTLILLGVCAGGREGDCVSLGRPHLFDVAGHWVLRYLPEKTNRHGTEAEVPVVGPLKSRLIKVLGNGAGSLLFCPTLAKERTLSKTFNGLVDKAGISYKTKVNPETKREMRSKTFHCLRHTLVSLLNEAGVDEKTRMTIVAHRDKDTHQGYTHVDIPGVEREMERALAGLSGAA